VVPDPSVRERLLEEVVARLKRIAGPPAYHFDLRERVERYLHDVREDKHSFNQIADTPAIIVFEGTETSLLDTTDEWANVLTAEIIFVLRGQLITAQKLGQALRDLRHALLHDSNDNVDTGFGASVTAIELESTRLQQTEEVTDDGLILTARFTYMSRIGDPSIGL
jgi:hypothetical protein